MHPTIDPSSLGSRRRGAPADTILQVFAARAALHPERVALRVLEGNGAGGTSITWGTWLARSREVAGALIAGGLRPGERVAVLAGNRPLWPVADLGILMAGGVAVGIYPTSAPAQVRQVLADSGAVAVVVDRREQLDKVLAVRADLPRLRTLVAEEPSPDALPWETLLQSGADALAAGAGQEVARRTDGASPADDAVLIYTSGSTGEPKGARISHGCVLASARCIQQTLGLTDADSSLSFLPFCHSAERIFGLYTRIACGMEAGLVEEHARVWEAALAFGPTLFGGLPRFYERVYEGLRAEEMDSRGPERERWSRVIELGGVRSLLRRRGEPVPYRLESEWSTRGEPIFARVRRHFGGRIRLATSGGAALPSEVAEYLDALGLTVLGAYGLTEHLCAAFNRPDRYAFDSAGPPMPGTEILVAGDGEILLRRGPLTFSGYHGRPGDTRSTFSPDGEWLLTGDLGFVGDDGCLRVTGRKKELLALSTGKKVAPLPIEALLLGDPLIGQAVLVGEGRKYVSALLVPRRPLVESWAREHGLALEYGELLRHPELEARLQKTVDAVNSGLSRTERIRRFLLVEEELSVERDELTPTLKIRRPVVLERFRSRLDALYLLPRAMIKRNALRAVFLSVVAIGAAYASAFAPGGAPRWAAWMMAVGIAVLMVSTMALGAARDGRLGRLALPFGFVFLVLVVGFGVALALPPASPADPELWFGLPPRAAIVLYGVGLLPLIAVPVAYALTFDDMTLSEEDLARVREAAARLRAGESVGRGTPEAGAAAAHPAGTRPTDGPASTAERLAAGEVRS